MSVEQEILITVLKLTRNGPIDYSLVGRSARIPAQTAETLLEKLADASLIRWLEAFNIPFLVVLTKSDKIPKSKGSTQQKIIKDFLLLRDEEIICFSTITRDGRQEILKRIIRVL